MIRSAPKAITSGPPATSDSLFAKATLFPAPRAARVGPNPIEPVIPLRTMSQGIAAISVDASGPSMTATPSASEPHASREAVVPTTGTRKVRACSKRSGSFCDPALRPTTLKSSGFAATNSRACTPIEPVEPRMTISRTPLAYLLT